MFKRIVMAVSTVLLSPSVHAMPESVVVHQMVRASAPLMAAEFAADYKKNQAYVAVLVHEDALIPTGENMDTESYWYRAPLELSLEANGDIVYTSEDGDSVVCARVVRKKILGITYRKVKATGACEFSTLLEPLDKNLVRATLEMTIKQ